VRVDWIHPSWRDLVIDALANDPDARRRFLRRCGVDGAALALSSAGGAAGERRRPLLVDDADWDALGDGLHAYCGGLDEREAIPLLNVLADIELDPESEALTRLVLARLGWAGKAVGVDALEAWFAVVQRLERRPEPPAVAMTWLELEPDAAPSTPQELERFADWLRLAELLQRHEPELLRRLGFPERRLDVLFAFASDAPADEPVLERELRAETLTRLAALAPEVGPAATHAFVELALPATGELLEQQPAPERSFPVERVLRDLVG
jgi:hypothetical protein